MDIEVDLDAKDVRCLLQTDSGWCGAIDATLEWHEDEKMLACACYVNDGMASTECPLRKGPVVVKRKEANS